MRQAMRMMKQILAVIACGLVCGCETTNIARQDSVHQSASPTFVHSFTKFSFPESVGSFYRVNVQKYDREGKDVGVGYNSSTPIAATVFVYPGAKDFALLPSPKLENVSELLLVHHYEACKQDVFRAHTDAKLIGEGLCTLIQGNNQFEGKKAVFSMSYKFGFASRESISELYVFLIEPNVKFLLTERYFVTYRITYPADSKSQAEKEISSFLSELKWPTK
jgi:hypothetical protein